MTCSTARRFVVQRRRLGCFVAFVMLFSWTAAARAIQPPPASAKKQGRSMPCSLAVRSTLLTQGVPELYGPANDIPAWRALLTAPGTGISGKQCDHASRMAE